VKGQKSPLQRENKGKRWLNSRSQRNQRQLGVAGKPRQEESNCELCCYVVETRPYISLGTAHENKLLFGY
jgi:hypothetical protein